MGDESGGVDPRLAIIPVRLKEVSKIVLVCSGKGGVGKTIVATLSALVAAGRGLKVGLLDLDFHGPSCHFVLGSREATPIEDRGLVPPTAAGVKLMSIDFFARGAPLPLRGREATDALIELLAVTRWGKLDLLFVDAPPGTGDELLDAARLLRKPEALVVTTPSKLSLQVVARLIALLRGASLPILGVVENMRTGPDDSVERAAGGWGVEYLGWIPHDPQLERALGDPGGLLRTQAAVHLEGVLRRAGLLR